MKKQKLNGNDKSNSLLQQVWPYTQDGRYRGSLQNYLIDTGSEVILVDTGLPDDWRCPRCKQPKEKFNKA